MLALALAASGLAFGSVAALSGIGLLITYRLTGVLNLAHGAVAMLVAYVYWQTREVWGWPRPLPELVALLLVGPGLGVLAYRLVFRDLQRSRAAAGAALVASLGLFVLLVGLAAVVWGVQPRRAPALLPSSRLTVLEVGVRGDALVDLAVVAVALGVLALVGRRTRLGVEVRAVVDDRPLAELSRVDADRVATLGWAVGCGFAGLTGVLLAPQLQLTPYGLTLLVLETLAVPVVARLSSLPVAVGAALAVGVAQGELAQVHLDGRLAGSLVRALQANLLAVVLLGALLVLRRLQELGGEGGSATRFASRDVTAGASRRRAVQYGLGSLLLVVPLALPAPLLRQAERVPALALVFVSLVVLTGYSGQISLGHGAFAGLGGLLGAAAGSAAGEGTALLVAVLGAASLGLLTGVPAIRRRGLFLALTTFAVGVAVSRFVFQQPVFTSRLEASRPPLLGVPLRDEHAFYLLELVCLGVGLVVVRNLREGRLGRALVALRDNEPGALAVGLDLRRLKVAVFGVSAGLAGLGGLLLVQTALSFDPEQFEPVQSSLFWFTAVVLFGADSAGGAVAAAGLAAGVAAATGAQDAALVPVGLLALALGRLPGGVVDLLRRAGALLEGPASLRAQVGRASAPAAPVRLSAAGRALRERLAAR